MKSPGQLVTGHHSFTMNTMVLYNVIDNHKVMTALMLVVSVLV
jgi:hypothetical protein